MNNRIKYIRKTRVLFLEILEDMTVEQLNEIPVGFNNNIIWNYGHAITSTLGLCYLRTDVEPEFKVPYGNLFGKGTRPEGIISGEMIDALKELALTSLDQIEKDLAKGLFDNVTPFATGTYGYLMDSIEEVLTCCLAHENLHFGTGKAQKVVVKAKFI